MNLLERNHHRDENGNKERRGSLQEFLHKPYMTSVLLGIIAVLLICIIVILMINPGGKKLIQTEINSDLQQNIADYAKEQQKNDYVSGLSGETVSIEPVDEEKIYNKNMEGELMPDPDSGSEPVSADSDKTAVVVDGDVEDENDVSYSKEFILSEAYPYFEANNQDAIWDLAHLKRYVKLSAGLKATNQYYYMGDVDSNGKPSGKGLAIYEDNSYYYGSWTDGVRDGTGTWFRFYINEKSKRNAMGKYTSHSYAGEWADDLPSGQGAEHYDVNISRLEPGESIMQNVVGGFKNGLYDGEVYGYTVDYTGTVGEWDGAASKGVFSLWRDMSSIGECSVWRNKEDHTQYMDIDQSQNQNQGIQELIKQMQ